MLVFGEGGMRLIWKLLRKENDNYYYVWNLGKDFCSLG